MQFIYKKTALFISPTLARFCLSFRYSTKEAPSAWKSVAASTCWACCRKWSKPSKNKLNARGSSIRDLKTEIDKHIYLRNIRDTNETLFYRLIGNHLDEMMPVIYTPTVGAACERFSEIYRRARGVFISYQNRHNLDDILQKRTEP